MIKILHLLWLLMVTMSVVYAAAKGSIQQVLPALLTGCQNALTLTIQLGAGYMLFCGLMEIADASGAAGGLERLIRPVVKRLMPCSAHAPEVRRTVTMNLTMNLLGMGNAATPMGIEAVRQLDIQTQKNAMARHDLYMLLILNATSIQLLPTTVLTLRAAAGSARVNATIVPTLLCTVVSTAVGVGLGALCRRERRRAG